MLKRGDFGAGFRAVERRFVCRNIHQRHIDGQVDMGRAGFAFALGIFERQTRDFRDGVWTHDELGALGDRLEDLGQIQKLMRGQMDLVGRDLSGDGDERRAVGIGVCNAGDEVGRAGAERGKAHACMTGQSAVYIRHESRALLVADGDESNGGAGERIHHGEVFFARNAKDDFDAFIFKAFDKQFCGVHKILRIPDWSGQRSDIAGRFIISRRKVYFNS